MKKRINLTESDLRKITKKIMNESDKYYTFNGKSITLKVVREMIISVLEERGYTDLRPVKEKINELSMYILDSFNNTLAYLEENYEYQIEEIISDLEGEDY